MEDKELLTPNQIIKSKRKSITLQIKNNGDFIVRAPIKINNKEIYKFIIEKKDWIIKKRKEQISSAFVPLTFNKDEKLYILGVPYPIVVTNNRKVIISDNVLFVPQTEAKEQIIKFLKKLSRSYLSKRVEEISKIFAFKYESISISSAKTCWGSCSHNNKLHFTYKLIMCPQEVIDYIILHELCHTKVKNHSSKFWDLVATYDPNYKIKEKWIKKNRGIINVI